MFVRIALVRAVSVCVGIAVKKNYFTSSHPRHDIDTLCYWQVFWHVLLDILSGIPSGILSGISLGIVSGISSRILCSILSGISSGILSDFLFFVLFGISSGIVSGCRGPAVRTELGRSQVEVQRISLMSQGPRLRSSGAGLDRKVPG